MTPTKPLRSIADRHSARQAFRSLGEIVDRMNMSLTPEQFVAICKARTEIYDLAGMAFPESSLPQME